MEGKGCCKEKPAEGSCSTEKTGACGDKTGACGGKSQCCPGTIIKGALVGGIVMFIWFSVSWMALPSWHHIMSFGNSDEQQIAMVLGHGLSSSGTGQVTPPSGIYVLPKQDESKGVFSGVFSVTKPYAFVSLFSEGVGSDDMKMALIKDFLFCLFGAALLTKVLKKRREGCCPVAGSMVIGLLVGAFSYLPNMIWFHFPLQYSLAGLADDVIAITLAGAVIGKCVLKSTKAGCGCRICNCTGLCNCSCCCKKPDPTACP